MSRTLHEAMPDSGRVPTRQGPTTEVSHAAEWREEGLEARAPVPAHQEVGEGARDLGGPRRGDRRAHRQQGARALGRVAHPLEVLDEGGVAEPPRRSALRRQPDARRALRAGQGARDRGPLEDEQGAARAGGRAQGDVARAPRLPLGRRRRYAVSGAGGGSIGSSRGVSGSGGGGSTGSGASGGAGSGTVGPGSGFPGGPLGGAGSGSGTTLGSGTTGVGASPGWGTSITRSCAPGSRLPPPSRPPRGAPRRALPSPRPCAPPAVPRGAASRRRRGRPRPASRGR